MKPLSSLSSVFLAYFFWPRRCGWLYVCRKIRLKVWWVFSFSYIKRPTNVESQMYKVTNKIECLSSNWSLVRGLVLDNSVVLVVSNLNYWKELQKKPHTRPHRELKIGQKFPSWNPNFKWTLIIDSKQQSALAFTWLTYYLRKVCVT